MHLFHGITFIANCNLLIKNDTLITVMQAVIVANEVKKDVKF